MSRTKMANDMIRVQAGSLKMPGLKRSFEGLARQARQEAWSFEEFLYEVLSAESSSRAESSIRQKIHEARFPEPKTLGEFDFTAVEGIDEATILTLARGEWIPKAQNLILAGPIGTGKTHLAIALGIEAAKQRRSVAFHRTADLVRSLVEARDARELGRLQRRLQRAELLILDELGFVPFDRTGGELLFNLIADRYERRSVLITTNLAFSEWPKVFADDEKLTTALLDRLAHHASVISTRGKSYRMRRRAGKGDKTTSADDGASTT
jgi:DNA replication protein DnaC